MALQNTLTVGINNNYLGVVTNSTTQLIVKILDVHGRFIKTMKKTLEQGVHECCINLDELAEGNYVVNTFNGEIFVRSIKYIKGKLA